MAQGIIQDVDTAFLDGIGVDAAEVRPGEGAHEQQETQDPEEEEQHIAQAERTLARDRLILQKTKGGEADEVGLLLVVQMQPNWGGDR